MSSSTSSSRKIFLRIFLVITLGMGISMAIIRVMTWMNGVSGRTFLSRVLEARDALPRIVAEEEDLVMFFGSSMTQAGFSARQFDRQLAERGVDVKSFNFGFGGLNPLFQDYLSRRVEETFTGADRRLKLAMIELVPFQLTQARYQGAVPVIDSFLGMLASPREMWEITREDPTRGLRILTIRYLRDGVSAEMTTNHFGGPLRPERPASDLPEDEEANRLQEELGAELNERFEAEYPDYAGENWHYGWQGAGTIPEERSESTREIFPRFYETLRTPKRMEDDKLWRIFCCDIEELRFEEVLVASFIRVVRNFQRFSDRVEVVLLPKNSAWIEYPPEAEERLRGLLQRITAETGAPIRDFQNLESITPEMFGDTTHLSRYAGDVVFTSRLAEVYAPVLAAGRAGTPDAAPER